MSQNTQLLNQYVQRAKSLYSLPAVAAQVLSLTEHPKVDSLALKECIENDPALTAKILRVVNSAQYGHAHGIADLGQALTVLGTKPLKMLVLGFSLPDELFMGTDGDTLLWYWRHTLTKAVAAREVCRMLWYKPGDEAFVAGLLADIGVLVLLQELKRDYSGFLRQVNAEEGNLLELERSALGFDHGQLGAILLRHWGLPASLTEAIGMAKERSILAAAQNEETEMARILHLAELVAQVVTEQRYDVLPELLAAGRDYRGMKRKQAEHLIQRLDGQVTQLARILAIDVNDGREYTALVTEAHRRLAEETIVLADQISALRDLEIDACDRLLDETNCLAQAANQVAFAQVVADPNTFADEMSKQSPPPGSSGARPTTAHQPKFAAVAMDAGLQGRLTVAASQCRQRRCELTLLLLEIDSYEQQLLMLSPTGCDRLRSRIDEICDTLNYMETVALQVDESRWAILISDCDRKSAVRCAGELLAARGRLQTGPDAVATPLPTLSIGAATLAAVPTNFAPQQLLESAERCLYGARTAGGGMVKSIEIY